MFYHEKREGDHWPLTENDITTSGSVELSKEDWASFVRLINGGAVTKKKEHIETGSAGPWMFLYWESDLSEYQEISFASPGMEASFEDFCSALKKQ